MRSKEVPLSDFQIGTIPEDHNRGWTVLIDGEPTQVGKLEIVHEKLGVLTYGLRPEGWDGWAFAETGGGGSITIPYCKTTEGELLVGFILENRSNMGGKRWCAIGGFKEPGETPLEAAVREAFEEAGVDFGANMIRLEGMPGLPGNANRLFFIANPDEDEGVHAYGLEVPVSLLQKSEDGYRFREGKIGAALMPKGDRGVLFMPWRDAVQKSADCLAGFAVARLVAVIN